MCDIKEDKIFTKFSPLNSTIEQQNNAACIIQLWFKSYLIIKHHLPSIQTHHISNGGKEKCRVLIHSILKNSNFMIKYSRLITVNQITLILEDIIEDAVQICFRSDFLIRRNFLRDRDDHVATGSEVDDNSSNKRSSMKFIFGNDDSVTTQPVKANQDSSNSNNHKNSTWKMFKNFVNK
jgi:hypothetical protein